MIENQLTFNDLPQVVAELLDEVSSLKAAVLLSLQNQKNQQTRENRHRIITPEQVADLTQIPLATVYQKLENGDIRASKPGKRWLIYLDDVDKWIASYQRGTVPQSDEEINEAIKASHRRKPKSADWHE